MSKLTTRTALAVMLSIPLIAGATAANASCQGRKDTGTLIGGVGGALLGNSISHGGGGAIIGGLGGAVVGHEIAKGGCGRVVYRTTPSKSAQLRQPATRVYYDQYGRPITTTQTAYPTR
jgi:uncharacterized protein YcfJ